MCGRHCGDGRPPISLGRGCLSSISRSPATLTSGPTDVGRTGLSPSGLLPPGCASRTTSS